ncbi:uncharacterized protein V6R79_001596 [Siganus canaliculatus]
MKGKRGDLVEQDEEESAGDWRKPDQSVVDRNLDPAPGTSILHKNLDPAQEPGSCTGTRILHRNLDPAQEPGSCTGTWILHRAAGTWILHRNLDPAQEPGSWDSSLSEWRKLIQRTLMQELIDLR